MESLQRLRVLREVALHGSFTAAGAAMHLSQPAISQHMSALERELGARLVDRSTTGARLTAAGEVALAHGLRMLQLADTARRELDELRSGGRSPVRIAAFSTACTVLLPAATRSFQQCRPSTGFDFVECEADVAIDRVRHGQSDLAIAFDYAAHPLVVDGLVTRHLADDPVLLAVPAAHRLARSAIVDVVDLADETWIAGTGFGCRESLRTVCGAANFAPRIALDSNRYPTTLALVGADHGIALVPRTAAQLAHGVVVVPLRPTPPPRRIWAVTAAEPADAVADLIDALAATLQRGDDR